MTVRQSGRGVARVWARTTERAFHVETPGTIAEFDCIVCTGDVVTRPLRGGVVDHDFEWVCNKCSAFGTVTAARILH